MGDDPIPGQFGQTMPDKRLGDAALECIKLSIRLAAPGTEQRWPSTPVISDVFAQP
jgi:hypothetical protein